MENNDHADAGFNEESIVSAMLKFPEIYATKTKKGAQKVNDGWLRLATDLKLPGK